MKTILVPTDFSDNAFIAAEYAASLATAQNFKVKLFHVYIVLYSGYENQGVSVQQIAWADEEAEKGMQKLVQTLTNQYPTIEIEGVCKRGFLVDALDQEFKDNPGLLGIVMGSKGATNLAENIFGSTTFEVLKRSKLPVLVIPGNTEDFKLDKVGFFTDFNPHEGESISKTRAFLGTETAIQLIHLTQSQVVDSKLQDKMENWYGECEKAGHPILDKNVTVIEQDQVAWMSVVRVLDSENLDVLAFTRPHKPFFAKLFHKSLTKEMANYPIAPSLFING